MTGLDREDLRVMRDHLQVLAVAINNHLNELSDERAEYGRLVDELEALRAEALRGALRELYLATRMLLERWGEVPPA